MCKAHDGDSCHNELCLKAWLMLHIRLLCRREGQAVLLEYMGVLPLDALVLMSTCP